MLKQYFLSVPISIITFLIIACSDDFSTGEQRVITGAEILIEHHLSELNGLRVGLVMNPTARIGEVHMLDTLLARDVNVTALYAPEHGFRGEAGAGEIIEDGVDRETGLPVFSLYGETRKPTGEMLGDVDILLFDMQDVGARFYTYNSTLGLILESASEYNVPVWVLDRPNPAGGVYVSGWILKPEYKSFVGMYPIPVAHGMTLGELGRMMIGERWIDIGEEPDFRVIRMEGWKRTMLWPDTGLRWFPPSPNLPTFEHAYVYLGTCLVEGTTVSEGRGTDDPFLLLGSPGTRFSHDELDQLQAELAGIELEKNEFTPVSIPGKSLNPKHEGDLCTGLRIRVNDYTQFDPVAAGLRILRFLMLHTADAETNNFLYRLAGTTEIDRILYEPDSEWDFNTGEFENLRKQYLLY